MSQTANLRFAESHEWVRCEGNKATIGISAFAVKELTDLTYVELPAVGKSFKAKQIFGVVESVKAASDLYAPVSGTVTKVNSGLESDLSVLSTDPYGKGWMIEVELASPGEVDQLLDEPAYVKFCASESH
ncbi:MAG: glycine cleavage system protein GcvH [Planctomycetota bacterium]|nr:MAG: glycine cleavage system protein GcvH [Planctomycetota bacterium]